MIKTMNIKKKITDLIGNTPLLEFDGADFGCKAKIALKLEGFNPAGSVKDRIALSLIEDAENKGLLNEGSTIIEPTSGNTGIGLAMVAAVKGYKLIIVMPEHMSVERRKLMSIYGAEIVLTPKEKGMNGSIEKAKQLNSSIENSLVLGQFENPANPQIHFNTTAKEIWNDTEGKVDIFVCGVGTGGTLTGCSKFLKSQNSNIISVAVEPVESAVISGDSSGPHGIQGIGAGFIPENLDVSLIDGIFKVSTQDALKMAKLVAKKGIGIGISSGAALKAAIEIAQKPENNGKLIVVIIPDGLEKYLSTELFADEA